MSRIANLIFELGQLRLENRRGWQRIGLRPENVAEHSLRAAQIAYILAVQENHPNPHYVATLAIFHDIAESRTGDPDQIAKIYSETDQESVVWDQTEGLGKLGDSIFGMWQETEHAKTHASKIAKDADRLEMAFTAKELMHQGHLLARTWMESVAELLETDSAKALFESLQDADPNDWWQRAIAK